MASYIGALIAVLVLAHICFFVAVKLRRNDLADVMWGPGFLIAALGAWIANPTTLGKTEYAILICLGIWAMRLALHIGERFVKSGEEDIRYRQWRKEWGKTWKLRTYFQVFILQASFLFVIVLSVLSALENAPREFSKLVAAGLCVWIFGFIFEAVGDHQLATFRSHPANKGKIIDIGLWSWSRHPNYFGEVVQWWGIFLMALNPTQPFWDSWWLIVSPLMITFLILKVSGIPMLEKLMKDRPGFAEYARRTSIFIPLPPRKT